jgi:hypothetical protein
MNPGWTLAAGGWGPITLQSQSRPTDVPNSSPLAAAVG